jgi:hypothetical protein
MNSRNRAAGRWPERKPGTNPMGGLVFGERSFDRRTNSEGGTMGGDRPGDGKSTGYEEK